MKHSYPLIFVMILLMSCGGSKSIYEDKNITDRKMDKLIRAYSANPNDQSTADQLKFAYDYLHNKLLSGVAQYQYADNLVEKEKLLNNYVALQSFYEHIRGYSAAPNLLKPGSVGTEIEKTKLELVTAHYEKAEQWINESNWRSARNAYQSLTKVQQLMPDYKNSKQLMKQAKEAGIIQAVVLPVSAEGFYYNNYNQTGYNNNTANPLPLNEQLVHDLSYTYNSNSWYKVYNPYEIKRKNITPNWTIQPIWTQLRLNDQRSRQYDRKVEKQTEIGKDTTGKPIYKMLTATLTITEVSYNGNGMLELRITDNDNHENLSPRSFSEEYNFKASTATYKGDAGALSNQDWEMINAPRYDNNRYQSMLEQKLIEKMYPNILNHTRSILNN